MPTHSFRYPKSVTKTIGLGCADATWVGGSTFAGRDARLLEDALAARPHEDDLSFVELELLGIVACHLRDQLIAVLQE
jgi:hypothetical protein